jgi:Phage-related protein
MVIPNQVSLGSAWPYPFPIRYAQIFGEDFSIPDYSITFQNNSYRAFPINYPGISISSDGSVGELNLELSSIDFALTSLVENPRLVGYNNTSSVSAYVNGDLVTNIDPRTVPGNALFDAAVVSIRGGQKCIF